MDFIDFQHPIIAAIYKTYEKTDVEEKKRGYLGASIIGAKCDQYLWYIFRECAEEKFDGRMLRLFDHGDCEEIRMIVDLRATGCEVSTVQGAAGKNPGKQWEILALGGHFSGHLDGIGRDGILGPEWHVLEFKTHNKKSFDNLKAQKVKKSHPKHYAQMQIYMCMTDFQKALYLAVHKDTDELYAEIVEYNEDDAVTLMLRAKKIITATEPPPRYSEDRNTFECCYCSANSICWDNPNLAKPEDALPRKSCRQCKHASPDIEQPGANWICGEGHYMIPPALPCEHYTLIPGILPERNK